MLTEGTFGEVLGLYLCGAAWYHDACCTTIYHSVLTNYLILLRAGDWVYLIYGVMFCFPTLNNSNEHQLIRAAAEGGGFGVADAHRGVSEVLTI